MKKLCLFVAVLLCCCTFVQAEQAVHNDYSFEWPEGYSSIFTSDTFISAVSDSYDTMGVTFYDAETLLGDLSALAKLMDDKTLLETLLMDSVEYTLGQSDSGIHYAILTEVQQVETALTSEAYAAFALHNGTFLEFVLVPLFMQETTDYFAILEKTLNTLSYTGAEEVPAQQPSPTPETKKEPLFDEITERQPATPTPVPRIVDPDEIPERTATATAAPAAQSGSAAKISLNEDQLSFTIDEDCFSYYLASNTNNQKSLERIGKDQATMDLYMQMSNLVFKAAPVDQDLADYSLNIRIKPDRYTDIGSVASLAASDRNTWGAALATSMGTNDFEMIEINGVCYCVYDYNIIGAQQRYATVYDDDMIYIYLDSKLGALTEEDRTLLRQFVESISYQ